MATQTTNIGLTKPSYTESVNIAVLNNNMDKIDSKIGNIPENETIKEAIDGKLNGPIGVGLADQILRNNGDGTTRWDNAASQTEIGEAVTEWLNDNVPTGETLVIDDSLSVQNAAAESKAAGNLIVVSESEPSAPTNKFWIKDQGEDEYTVPLFTEFLELESTVESIDLESRTIPKVVGSDAEDVDIDVADEDGNVIVRFAGGHIEVKEFDSRDIGDLDELETTDKTSIVDAINEVNGAVADKIDMPTGGTAGQVLGLDSNLDPVWINQSGGGGGGSGLEPETKSTNSDSGVFDITDNSGNVLARFQNGYIKTQKFDSTDPFELPSYYPSYLDSKCERIKTLMKAAGGDGDTFIFITDQHMDNNCAKNTHHSFKMIKYIAEKCRITKLFCGGDLKNGGDEQYADEFRRAIGGRCYMANGNHEYLSNGDEKTLDYWNTATTDDEIGNHERRYFYVDNPKNMVRYIVLSSYGEEQTPGGGASIGFEQDQQDWLVDAMDVESGWSIVIFAHAFYVPVDMTAPVLRLPEQREAMLDLIDENANGHDVFIIQGHTHFDAIEETNDGFPILITTCDKWEKAEGEGVEEWLHARTPGTITEHAFDVCVLNKEQRKITAVRIGAFSSGSDETDATLTEAGERIINIT